MSKEDRIVLHVRHFFTTLEHLASIKQQRQLWLNEDNDTGLMYCFAEHFMDIDTESMTYVPNKVMLDTQAQKDFLDLIELALAYKEPASYRRNSDDRIIVNDPNWIRICQLAYDLMQVHEAELSRLKQLYERDWDLWVSERQDSL
jgi:hypothetical protein